MSNWRKIARKEQLQPEGDWKIWIVLAGRGFGKTRTGAETVLELINNNKCFNIGILGETIFEARNIMVEGLSGILRNSFQDFKYLSSSRKIIFNNGSVCQFFGADKFNKLRGFQFDLVWIDEFAKFKNCEEVLTQVFMCLRLGLSKLIITTTPQNKKPLLDLLKRKDVTITNGTSFNNNELSQGFFDFIKVYENSNIEKQEILGEIVGNFLWNKSDIKYGIAEIVEYIIGIDPAVENGVTGMILTGLGIDNNFYVLEDYSSRGSPSEWLITLKKITEIYANNCTVVIEVNHGGKLLSELISLYNIDCTLKTYRAYDSKQDRNIISFLLYNSDKVYHAKPLEYLENEMLFGQKDRVDALHWALFYYKSICKF